MKAKPKAKKTKAITVWGVLWLDRRGEVADLEVSDTRGNAFALLADFLSGHDEAYGPAPRVARITVEPQ